MSTWQFVDSIASSPTVRLDLNSATGGLMLAGEPELSPPDMDRVTTASMLADGEKIPAAAFRNRVIRLPIQLVYQSTTDLAAAKLQSLARELVRQPGNILRTIIGSSPMFFRTFPAPDAAYQLMLNAPQWGNATLEIPCEPFGYGLKEALSPVAVYNDPAEGVTLNLNPYFETDASDWSTSSGTFVRSTAQSHEGAASGLFTPNGVAATAGPVTGKFVVAASTSYRFSVWVRCAVARNVDLGADWYTAGSVFISSATPTTVAVAANTWTLVALNATSAGTAGLADLYVAMTGTPPASNTLHIDEARARLPGSNGAMYLDIASPKGDVETPLYVSFATGNAGLGATGRLRSALAMRRRGTPSATPFALQAEAMTMSIADTTVQSNSALMSGAGSNFVKVAFTTSTGMANRIQTTTRFPSSASVDARGTYRVFARVRQNTATDIFDMRLLYGSVSVQITGDTVRLPADTGPAAPTLKYVDLGLMQTPIGFDPVYDGLSGVELGAEGNFLIIQAQRVSGTGTLDIDVLLFVPADDRLEFVLWPEVQNFSTDTFVAEGGPRPAAYCLNTGGQVSPTEPIEITGGGMMITPGRTNRLYFIRDLGTGTAQTGAGDSITATGVLTCSYYPRYLFPLRPVST